MEKITEYQKVLEKFRTHYRNEYGINLDDEVLYFFVRVNEMQSGLKKDIHNLTKITFKTGWDYFLYGLGKWLIPSLIFSISWINKNFHNLIPLLSRYFCGMVNSGVRLLDIFQLWLGVIHFLLFIRNKFMY